MTRPELLIIGAGPSGLGLAASYSGPSRIIEQAGEVGGLCRSVEFGGAVFDIGGHSFHTPHAEVARLVEDVMAGRMEAQRRDARICFDGALIDYPFQQHLGQIADAKIAAECRNALPDHPATAAAPDNFAEWILARFGTGVARHFMLPYNRKLWARDLAGMSCEWVGERIAGMGNTAGAAPARRIPLSRDSLVSYPADGGFGEICRALARRAGPIELDQPIVSVDPDEATVRTAAGNVYHWNQLVSTMPLPVLLDCLAGCPGALRDLAAQLEYVSLKIVMIAANKGANEPPQRLYVPDPGVPAHKIAFNHRSSSALRARPCEAVMCEISFSSAKPVPSDAVLELQMVEWLAAQKLIGEPVAVRTIDVPFAYPVPTPGRAPIVAAIRAYLLKRRIFTIGRFGGWNYANSDGCLHEAMTLARRLECFPGKSA